MLESVLTRFNNEVLLVSGTHQGLFESCVYKAGAMREKLQSDDSKPKMASEDEDFWFAEDDWRSFLRPYIVKDGILQIPVKGVLFHDFPYQFFNFATGYEYIWKAFERGMGDENVKGIALVIDSPGGEVAGNFDLVDRMFNLRGTKPVRAFAAESAYSAAYSIASVADTLTVSRTGGVGSIGVITSHCDWSGAMDQMGIKVTLIFEGPHKADGNPYGPLPDDVRDAIKARIGEIYGIFVSTVARNRAMDEGKIRDTQSRTFTASQAVSNGLADAIGSLDDAVAAFVADLSKQEEDETMAGQTTPAVDQAAETAKQIEAARNDALAEGAKAARERTRAITSSDAGKKRPTLAAKMATDEKFAALDASTIIDMLNDLPEEKATAPAAEAVDDSGAEPKGAAGAAKDFAAAMSKDNPDLGEQVAPNNGQMSRVDRAFAAAGKTKPKAA